MCISYARSPGPRSLRSSNRRTRRQFKANEKMPPMGHFGDVEKEIGRACVQLALPDFKYMSGETITLEDGMGLRP